MCVCVFSSSLLSFHCVGIEEGHVWFLEKCMLRYVEIFENF